MNTYTLWTLYTLTSTAILLSVFYNRQPAKWFVLKMIGVIASTIPIIGILQGGMFLEKDPRHSRACFFQAALAIIAYFILRYGFGIDILQ